MEDIFGDLFAWFFPNLWDTLIHFNNHFYANWKSSFWPWEGVHLSWEIGFKIWLDSCKRFTYNLLGTIVVKSWSENSGPDKLNESELQKLKFAAEHHKMKDGKNKKGSFWKNLSCSLKILVDIWLTEWRVDGKKNDCWPKKFLIKFLYVL